MFDVFFLLFLFLCVCDFYHVAISDIDFRLIKCHTFYIFLSFLSVCPSVRPARLPVFLSISFFVYLFIYPSILFYLF